MKENNQENSSEYQNTNIPKKMVIAKKQLIIIGVVILAVLVIFLIINRKNKLGENSITSIYSDINKSVYLSEILSDDQYNAWHYGIFDDNHSTYSLASKISLNSSDLNNTYCSSMTYKDDWEYVIYCVQTAHEDKGNYKKVKDILDSVKNRINNLDNEKENVKELKKYYQAALSYYNLANDYNGSFNQYKDDIKDMRNKIEDLQNELDLSLNYDHETDKTDFKDNSNKL